MLIFLDIKTELVQKIIEHFSLSSEQYAFSVTSELSQDSIIFFEDWDSELQAQLLQFEGKVKALVATMPLQHKVIPEPLACRLIFNDELKITQLPYLLNSIQLLLESQKAFNHQQDQFSHLNQEMKNVLLFLEDEAQQARKNHKRSENTKKFSHSKIDFYGIYKIGRENGGEYYDLTSSDRFLFYWCFSSDQYSVLALLTDFSVKIKNMSWDELDPISFFKDALEQFIEKISTTQKEEVNYQFLIAAVDLQSLKFDYFTNGNFKLYMPTGRRTENSFSLLASDRLLILSPGVSSNYQKNKEKNIDQTIDSFLMQMSHDLLDEIMASLNSSQTDRFLAEDACGFYMEVKKNVLQQV